MPRYKEPQSLQIPPDDKDDRKPYRWAARQKLLRVKGDIPVDLPADMLITAALT